MNTLTKPANPSWFHLSSCILALIALVIVLKFELLVAVLATCGSFALARSLPHCWPFNKAGVRAHTLASVAVGAVPVLVLIAGGIGLSYLATHASAAYTDVIGQLNNLIGQWRDKLPAAMAAHLPDGPETIKPWLNSLVQSQAEKLTDAGKSGAHGLLMALVGIVMGLLLANTKPEQATGPLAEELCRRASALQNAFIQIVRAQLWIAIINTGLTAVFFYAIVPLLGTSMPYAPLLLLMTFFTGLLPVVGNLICNTVMTMVAVSVSPVIAVAALIFLIAIHKAEYLINAKVVGSRMNVRAWELIAAMFVMEALFGVAGLVAAPLFYAYIKTELRTLSWV